jgi:hypothetical protein
MEERFIFHLMLLYVAVWKRRWEGVEGEAEKEGKGREGGDGSWVT